MSAFLIEIIIYTSLISAGTVPVNPASAAGSTVPREDLLVARSSEAVSFSEKEIKDVLSAEKDMIHFNRFGGLLNDILREQKKAFLIYRGKAKNEVALEVEGLMNEANLSASEDNYDEGYKSLEKAYHLIVDSMKQLTKGK